MDVSGVGYSPDAAVLAGLHMYEANGDPEVQKKIIISLRDPFFETFYRAAKHVELASVGSMEFMKVLAQEAVPAADSVGMNEQELADLFEASGGQYAGDTGVPSRDLLVRLQLGTPVASACALRHIMSVRTNFRVHRMHLHTLAFHMEVRRPGRIQWRDATASLFAGTVRATTKACGGVRAEELSDADLRLIAPTRVDASDPLSRLQLATMGRRALAAKLHQLEAGVLNQPGKENLEAILATLSPMAMNESVLISDLSMGDILGLMRRGVRRVPDGVDMSFVGLPEPMPLSVSAENAEFELQSGLVGRKGTQEWREAAGEYR